MTYLTAAQILFIHARLLSEIGGAFGLRDAIPHLSNTLGHGIAALMHLMVSIPNGLLLEHRLQAH